MWNRQVPSLIPMQRDARLHNERSSTQASAFLHFHLLSGSSNSHRKSTLRREIKTQDLEQEQADSELQLQLQDGATSNLRPHWSSCLCLCVLFLSCPSCSSCVFRQNQETKCSVLPQHTNTHPHPDASRYPFARAHALPESPRLSASPHHEQQEGPTLISQGLFLFSLSLSLPVSERGTSMQTQTPCAQL